jgi:hypothetical protein
MLVVERREGQVVSVEMPRTGEETGGGKERAVDLGGEQWMNERWGWRGEEVDGG